MLTQTQINLQKQDQQLGYDILGRLFCAAENYYLKCKGESYNHQTTKYSGYDIFNNANKKSKESVRRELINQINIFQTSNQYFMSKYKFGLQPPNLALAINDLNVWKKSMKNPKDIELYDSILKVINNSQVNTDNFSNDHHNQEYNRIGRQEFWSNIGTYSSVATQQRIEEINSNPNYQPTFNRGSCENPYSNSKPSEADEKTKLIHDTNELIYNLVSQFEIYYKGKEHNLITDIIKNYNKLSKLKNKIDENSTFIFPESIIAKEAFISQLDALIKYDQKKENKKVFTNIKELFVEIFL